MISKSHKSYVAVFICLVTRAAYLEAVTDLSSEAFLAAYRRFTARRGHCKEIFSDNGTNFKGAANILDKDLRVAIKSATELTANLLTNDGTTWKFIPPGSPHMGGIWEAGVKSMKTHLRKIVGDTRLTFEEFSTVLCRVEACLNSRPITPLSADPQDSEAVTPGHFLIDRPLLHPPEAETSPLGQHPHTRWILIKQLSDAIWKRWSTEYIDTLQQRTKWKVGITENLKIGDLVLIKEDNMPPLKWAMGRVLKIHPGQDNKVRVVTLKAKGNEYMRPIAKLAPLPFIQDISITSSPSEKPSINIQDPQTITESQRQQTSNPSLIFQRVENSETQPDCIISKITNRTVHSKCEFEPTEPSYDEWYELNKQGDYLYFTTYNREVQSTCGTRLTMAAETKVLIHLEPGCKVTTHAHQVTAPLYSRRAPENRHFMLPATTDNIPQQSTIVKHVVDNHSWYAVALSIVAMGMLIIGLGWMWIRTRKSPGKVPASHAAHQDVTLLPRSEPESLIPRIRNSLRHIVWPDFTKEHDIRAAQQEVIGSV